MKGESKMIDAKNFRVTFMDTESLPLYSAHTWQDFTDISQVGEFLNRLGIGQEQLAWQQIGGKWYIADCYDGEELPHVKDWLANFYTENQISELLQFYPA